VASISTKKGIGVVQYYELPFGSGFFVSDTYHIPTRILRNIFVQLDTRDSPKKPGKVLLSTMTDAIDRFHRVLCAPPYQDAVMRQEADQTIAELEMQAHSRRGKEKYPIDDDDRPMVSWDQDLVFKVFRVRLPRYERLFFTFDISENSTWASQSVSVTIMLSIFMSILTFVIESVPGPKLPKNLRKSLPYIDMVCVMVFTVDYLVRLSTVPWARMQLLDKQFIEDVFTGRIDRRLLRPTERLRRFLTAPMGLVDLLSCAPFWVELVIETSQGNGIVGITSDADGTDALRILRFVRLVRVLKLGKVTRVDLGEDRNMVLQLFGEVVGRAKPALQLVALLILLAMLTFGSLIWFAERGIGLDPGDPRCPDAQLCKKGPIRKRADGQFEDSLSPFESIPASFWWVLVTITTVGYGDHYPVTEFGYLIGAATILYGVVVFALPVGIIGTAFSQAYDQILEDQAYRKSLEQEEIESKDREADPNKHAAPNFHEPPAVFNELWISIHRTAMAAGIPLAMAKTWQSEMQELACFENLSTEHPCDTLEKWGTPIMTTLKQHITHLDTATKYMSRLRVVWYSILFKISEAHSEFMQNGLDRRHFDETRSIDEFPPLVEQKQRYTVRSDVSNGNGDSRCTRDRCKSLDVPRSGSPPSLPPDTNNPHKTSL